MNLLEYNPKKPHKSIFKLDLQDKHIGKYHVIKRDENKYGNWKCICECGNRLSIRGTRLIKNEREFCKKCKPRKTKEKNNRSRQCKKCGKSYEMSENAKHSKFCSKICSRDLKTICKICGKEFPPRKGTQNVFCSLQCKIKNHYKINEDGCWIWVNVHEHAYGSQISFDNKRYTFTRIAYELSKREIPKGMFLTRKCKNYKCVNPDHHEVITKERFYKLCNHNNVTKRINVEIVEKIIELHECGLNPEEIVKKYSKNFKYKSFRKTSS
jgi:hypothetical protein